MKDSDDETDFYSNLIATIRDDHSGYFRQFLSDASKGKQVVTGKVSYLERKQDLFEQVSKELNISEKSFLFVFDNVYDNF